MRYEGSQGRQEHGIALLFVVVLLALLAITGTVFLTVVRSDRAQVTMANRAHPLQSRIEAQFGEMEQRVFQRLVDDLFAIDPAGWYAIRQKQSVSEIEKYDLLASKYRVKPQRALPTEDDATPPQTPAFTQGLDASVDGFNSETKVHRVTIGARSMWAPRRDGFLASTFPLRLNPAGASAPVWPYLSEPLLREPNAAQQSGFTPRFVDPRFGSPSTSLYDPSSGQLERFRFLEPTSISVARNATDPNSTPAVYPALRSGSTAIIAGDADGDGIADCGLQYVGTESQNPDLAGVRYYVGYRVVDNSSRININTAYSVTGDWRVPTETDLVHGPLQVPVNEPPDLPNYGLFRSNVGLIELLDNWNTFRPSGNLNPLVSVSPTTDKIRHLNFLMGLPNGFAWDQSTNKFSYFPTPDGTSRIVGISNGNGGFDYKSESQLTPPQTASIVLRRWSIGQVLENELANRLNKPGKAEASLPSPLKPYWTDSILGLDARPGLLAVEPNLSDVEENLNGVLVNEAVNQNGRGRGEFAFFPPNAVNYWFESLFNFDQEPPDSNTLKAEDLGYRYDRLISDWGARANPLFFRSPRALLTGRSGLSHFSAAYRWGGNQIVPPGTAIPPFTQVPPTKVDPNTADVNLLWRSFWMLMAHPDTPSLPILPRQNRRVAADAFASNLRPLGTDANDGVNFLNRSEMLLIRSALAACNTVDMRDADNNLTKVTLEIPRLKRRALVYGREQQPYITRLIYDSGDRDNAGKPVTVVELHNPSDRPLSLKNFVLMVVRRDGKFLDPEKSDALPNEVIAPGGFVVILPENIGNRRSGPSILLSNGTRLSPRWDVPGGVNVIRSEALNDLYSSSNRKWAEIMLMRPVDLAGTLPTRIDELFQSLAPVDQVDLNGMSDGGDFPPSNATAVPPRPWRAYYVYARNNHLGTNGILYGGLEREDKPLATSTHTWQDAGFVGNGHVMVLGQPYNDPVPDSPGRDRVPYRILPLNGLPSLRPDLGAAEKYVVSSSGAEMFPYNILFPRVGDMQSISYVGSTMVLRLEPSPVRVIDAISGPLDANMSDHPREQSEAGHCIGMFVNEQFDAQGQPVAGYPPYDLGAQFRPGASGSDRRPGKDGGLLESANDEEHLISGLVNLNTAPRPVLELLPLIVDEKDGQVPSFKASNPRLRKEHRTAAYDIFRKTGSLSPGEQADPFSSLFDPDLTAILRYNDVARGQLRAKERRNLGDFFVRKEPGSDRELTDKKDLNEGGGDGIRDLMNVTRISQIASTRSDCFTVHITVQAWKGEGGNARLIGERRRSYLVDRSAVDPLRPDTVSADFLKTRGDILLLSED